MHINRLIIGIFLVLVFPTVGNSQKHKLEVFFPTASYEIANDSKGKLDAAVYNELIKPDDKLKIVGYTDYVGSEKSNVQLSINRAQAAKDYLVSLSIAASNITVVEGLGEMEAPSEISEGGFAPHRKVVIFINPKADMIMPIRAVVKEIDHANKTLPSIAAIAPQPISLNKIKKGEAITLPEISFPFDRHVLEDKSFPTLQSLVKELKNNPNIAIQIEGHVCCITKTFDAFDLDAMDVHLSRNRAKSVYDYLVENGIAEERLKYQGFGNSKPKVSPEKTDADKSANRRVEVRIMD